MSKSLESEFLALAAMHVQLQAKSDAIVCLLEAAHVTIDGRPVLEAFAQLYRASMETYMRSIENKNPLLAAKVQELLNDIPSQQPPM